MERFLIFFKRIIPQPVFNALAPLYHLTMAWLAALWYGFPSRRLKVIGVTGTKGKSTVVYLTSELFHRAGESVAAVGSLGYRILERTWPNPTANTMPGRFRLQKFLYDATRAGAQYAVIEVTSEGIAQFRHIGIHFDCAVFTNLEPEHIERHGSFEAYYGAKQKLFRRTKNIHIINKISPHAELFSGFPAKKKLFYSPETARIHRHQLKGDFNLQNVSAAYTIARAYNILERKADEALAAIPPPPGRLEEIKSAKSFRVFIDYAHTPGSLRSAYEALQAMGPKRLVCVAGAAGGNRDKWKRPELGKIAGEYCDEIILTNEDPFDEDPMTIIEEIAAGIPKEKQVQKILERREAIERALTAAGEGDIVIITGKGSETSIRVKDAKKIPWNEREVVEKLLS